MFLMNLRWDYVTTTIVSQVTGCRVQARICVLNGTTRERVVVSDSVPLKKFVAVCLDEVLVARQNALGQRSDGGQFERLLRTLQGAREVTVAVPDKLCGIFVANSRVTYRATTHVSL